VRKVESYVAGSWYAAPDEGEVQLDAATGEPVAAISTTGIDLAAMLDHARNVGGPAIRRLTFHERALALKALATYLLERKDEFHAESLHTGAIQRDGTVDIEGGIQTVFGLSSKARREMPASRVYVDGGVEQISKTGTFLAQHIATPMQGVAVQINAFNFPVWGMLEKLAPTFLAGMPTIVKPASQTAYVTELVFRRMIESGLLPEGSVQLLAGPVHDLLDHLTGQDVVAFTGSAATAAKLRSHPAVVRESVRFTAEADSLNASILGPDAEPGSPELDLFVKEVAREMTAKAGQKCTAIRRALVPERLLDPVVDALRERLSKVVVGDPRDPSTTMGALVSTAQRDEVRRAVAELRGDSELVLGDPDQFDGPGAFLPPLLLLGKGATTARCHEVEPFGPVATVLPYDGSADEAITLTARGRGSLVASVFSYDTGFARDVVHGLAPYHGRLMVLDRDSAKESTGHGSPLPHLVHGGPGRAGGGEELGGVRGVLHHMQRTAVQGSPTVLTAVTGRYVKGARPTGDTTHPFRKYLEELAVGDTLVTASRIVTLEDIEAFAALSGDTFYAHMDDEAARANPLFEGRVAHGYFIVSLAAGLFVDPAPGPVLANSGLENLRFLTPVYPGDTLTVTLVCKQVTPRVSEPYGEVRWDVDVTNQDGASVARYDVLTLVAKKEA
jgi:oxepin-CoA hydrolase / 3-oxo-5,6-dehydrosuberyl-CoA semialdehyde dehydrogenase